MKQKAKELPRFRGYNITIEPQKQVLLRASFARIAEEFFSRIVATALLVFAVVILEAKGRTIPWWGLGLIMLLLLFLILHVGKPVLISLDLNSGNLISRSTLWGYPLKKELVFSKELKVRREYETPGRGLFRSVQLIAQSETADVLLLIFVATSREKLDEQVADFIRLLHEELNVSVTLLFAKE